MLASDFTRDDEPFRQYHSRPIHRRGSRDCEDQAWKTFITAEQNFLVEGQLVESERIQRQIDEAHKLELYLLEGKEVLEQILCGPKAQNDLGPWKSAFKEYGQWDYKNLSFEDMAAQAEAAAKEAEEEEEERQREAEVARIAEAFLGSDGIRYIARILVSPTVAHQHHGPTGGTAPGSRGRGQSRSRGCQREGPLAAVPDLSLNPFPFSRDYI
jgi:hypothetical protein